MVIELKDNWIINENNEFEISNEFYLAIYIIQYEISLQIDCNKITTITEYLGSTVDIKKNTRTSPFSEMSIKDILVDTLKLESWNRNELKNTECSYIIISITDFLHKLYMEESCKTISNLNTYKENYNQELKIFLSDNIDTDENDFIKDELNICKTLKKELQKKIYCRLNPFEIEIKHPCEFKKNLINSIDKRQKFLKQKGNEKYPKVKALFQLIEYLHSNIENFNQYKDLIKELEQLDKKRSELNPEQNYKDKQQYDKIQSELEVKFDRLQDNTANLIKAKAIELNICNPSKTETLYNWNIDEIQEFKKNFSDADLPEIFKNKSKYLEYRSNTHGTFLSLEFFFDYLDRIAKSLFDYFKDNEQTEFEAFQTKATPYKDAQSPLQSEKPKPELSLRQIALIYVYSDKQITEHNGNEIAEKHGWTSGRKLWQHFNFYYQKVNRKGLEETKKKTENKIKLIESVVELLPTVKQGRAIDEVLILRKIYKVEYQ